MTNRRRWVAVGVLAGVFLLAAVIVPFRNAAMTRTLIGQIDGVHTLALMGFEDTEYGPGYTHAAFLRVVPGLSEDEVRALIGRPMGMRLDWSDTNSGTPRLQWLGLDHAGLVITPPDLTGRAVDSIRAEIGNRHVSVWVYSRSPTNRSYRVRRVHFRDGRVTSVETGRYND